LSAIAGVIFLFLLLGAVLWIGWKLDQATSLLASYYPTYETRSSFILLGKFAFARNLDYVSILLLIVCPTFLFLSLAAFARGNLARQTRRRTALTYTLLGIVALSPVSLGFSRLAAGIEPVDWVPTDSFWLQSISRDGTQILIGNTRKKNLGKVTHYVRPRSKWSGYSIDLIDLAEGRVRTIETNRIFRSLDISARFVEIGGKPQKVLLYKMHRGALSRVFADKIVLVDLETSRKKEIYSEHRFDENRGRGAYTSWSPDGQYFALIKRPPRDRKENGYIALADSSGNFIGKHMLAAPRESRLYEYGWDYKSRFYFTQYFEEPPQLIISRRISPDDMIPEEFPSAPFDNYVVSRISPDGRQIVLTKRPTVEAGKWKHGIYNVEDETYQSTSKRIGGYWSPDSRMSVRMVLADPPPGVEPKKGIHYSRLILYDKETGTSRPAIDEALPNLNVRRWSPSGKYLLLESRNYVEQLLDWGGTTFLLKDTRYVLNIENDAMTEINHPFEFERNRGHRLQWTLGDRLMWFDKDRLIATEIDGSKPEELFRIEKGKYYLYGKEVG
jgi:hypothetical protein